MLGTLTRALVLLPPEMRGRWAALVPLLLLTPGRSAGLRALAAMPDEP